MTQQRFTARERSFALFRRGKQRGRFAHLGVQSAVFRAQRIKGAKPRNRRHDSGSGRSGAQAAPDMEHRTHHAAFHPKNAPPRAAEKSKISLIL